MITIYTTDSMGVYTGPQQISKYAAIPKGSSLAPPPDAPIVQLQGETWVVLEAYPEPAPPAPEPVPASCTRRQGLLALLSYGIKRSEIETQIETIEDEMEREAAWIEYLADTWELGNPRLQAMWAALGGTPEQLDDLFRHAVTL